jgi:hypothetical protein
MIFVCFYPVHLLILFVYLFIYYEYHIITYQLILNKYIKGTNHNLIHHKHSLDQNKKMDYLDNNEMIQKNKHLIS